MQLGIFAKTFPGTDVEAVLREARDAGYATVQFNMACLGLAPMPDRISADEAASIAEAARNTGVALAAVSGTYNMIHPDPAVRARGLARLDVLAGSAHAMGTRLLTLCTGTRDAQDQWRHHPDNTSAAAWGDLICEMEKAIAIAERHDVDLGIEPELANVISSAEKARHLLDDLASPRLRIVLDPANLFEVETDSARARIIAKAIDLLGPDIAMAHAKDRHADGSFATAGTGVVDFGYFLSRLIATGFDGPLVTHGLAADEAASVAAFLGEMLERVA